MDEIEIVPYDDAWPKSFERERGRLAGSLGDLNILDILHFGSTAIPGMPAKPIIDILMLVPDIGHARETLPGRLDALGYDFWADSPRADRLFFVKGMPPRGKKRTHHVHVCEPGSEMHRRLAFLDYLRANPDEAAAYAAVKEDLATKYRNDREAYTNAKKAFVDRIMALTGQA